jgi:hypothetical protein
LLRYEIEKLGGKATQVVESTDKARKKKRAAVDNTLIESNNNNVPVVTPVVTPVKPPPSPYKHFPTQMFVLFDSVNLPPVIKKIKEVNAELAIKSDPNALNDAELKRFDHVIETLTQTSKYHVTSFTKDEFQAVQKLLSWPIKQRFPCKAINLEGVTLINRSNIQIRHGLLPHPRDTSARHAVLSR